MPDDLDIRDIRPLGLGAVVDDLSEFQVLV
jgi:hypothetical protein